jgi:hypothetical protein
MRVYVIHKIIHDEKLVIRNTQLINHLVEVARSVTFGTLNRTLKKEHEE